MTPDWSAQAEPIPYAKLDHPQSLNLYTYSADNPTSIVDVDGHTIDLTGDQREEHEEAMRIIQNASQKGEKELFAVVTGKDGQTRFELNARAVSHYRGRHSNGFKIIAEVINSKHTATVAMTNTDSRIIPVGHGNFKVELDRNVAGIDRVAPEMSPEGKPIPNPFNIIAGHELLGHARLGMMGKPNGGIEARQVESALRKEQELPLRDLNSN